MRSSTDGMGRRWRTLLGAAAVAVAAGLSACAPMGAQAGGGYAASPDRTAVIAVNFDLDSHRIRPEYYPALDSVAAAILSQQLTGYSFDVDGHTDLSGRLAYNIALSVLRAQAVVDYLAARGVPRQIMRPQGFGPLNLLNPGNPFGAENRRVEVTSIR